ncbi:MAG: hypothetical protein U0174_03195 [Polyangiaceae bacterium]
MRRIWLALRRSAWLLSATWTLTGCPLPMPHPEPGKDPLAPEQGPEATPAASGIQTTIRAPAKAAYDPRSLGAPSAAVKIRVENTSTHALSVTPMRVSFRATRSGVPFSCSPAKTPAAAREPSTLQPGQSFEYERDLSCVMPLPGVYDVRTYVDFAADPTRASEQNEKKESGRFSIEFVATTSNAPQPYPAIDGLFVLMTGAQVTRPLSSEQWARGDYQVVLAFVNGGSKPITVGPGHIAFLVYKQGTALPCSGQEGIVAGPEELLPGAMHIVRSPVACAPSEEGNYAIVGRLRVDRSGSEVAVGKIPLRVTGEPRAIAPIPWGPWGSWPSSTPTR